MTLLLEIIGVALALVGLYLVIKKNRWGFIFWVASNCFLVPAFITKGLWLTVGLFGVYTIINLCGFHEWSKEE